MGRVAIFVLFFLSGCAMPEHIHFQFKESATLKHNFNDSKAKPEAVIGFEFIQNW